MHVCDDAHTRMHAHRTALHRTRARSRISQNAAGVVSLTVKQDVHGVGTSFTLHQLTVTQSVGKGVGMSIGDGAFFFARSGVPFSRYPHSCPLVCCSCTDRRPRAHTNPPAGEARLGTLSPASDGSPY